MNQSDDFASKCKGTNGNPPANVTWYKDNRTIVTGKEETTFVLNDVDKDNSGTYRCEAKNKEEAKNETSMKLIINCKYHNV